MPHFAPGDLAEVRLPDGFAYLQVTHLHPAYGEIVRALPGVHGQRPDLATLVCEPSPFVAMVALSAAVETGAIKARRVEGLSVPPGCRRFPTFQMPILDKHDGVRGAVAYRWLWSGDGLTYATDDCPHAAELPLREIMPIRAVLARLASASGPGRVTEG